MQTKQPLSCLLAYGAEFSKNICNIRYIISGHIIFLVHIPFILYSIKNTLLLVYQCTNTRQPTQYYPSTRDSLTGTSLAV